jgi:hypothetical protein
MTTLGTPSPNDRSTAAGAHPDQEAVGALAAHDGRLESAFHGCSLLKKRAITSFRPAVCQALFLPALVDNSG